MGEADARIRSAGLSPEPGSVAAAVPAASVAAIAAAVAKPPAAIAIGAAAFAAAGGGQRRNDKNRGNRCQSDHKSGHGLLRFAAGRAAAPFYCPDATER